MAWYHDWAWKNGFQVSEEMEECINAGLERNKSVNGARYCPCKLDLVASNVCPCVELRTTGHCHCGLFIKEEVNKY